MAEIGIRSTPLMMTLECGSLRFPRKAIESRLRRGKRRCSVEAYRAEAAARRREILFGRVFESSERV